MVCLNLVFAAEHIVDAQAELQVVVDRQGEDVGPLEDHADLAAQGDQVGRRVRGCSGRR